VVTRSLGVHRCHRRTCRTRRAPATQVTSTRTTNSQSRRCLTTNTRKSSKTSRRASVVQHRPPAQTTFWLCRSLRSTVIAAVRSTRPHYGSCPSVSVRAHISKTKRCRKTKIGVNVSQGRSNRCANFQLKRSKVRIRVNSRWTAA